MSGDASPTHGEEEARSLAAKLPETARVIALLHEPARAERAAIVADEIATALGRRRDHTLLAGAEPGPSPLDALLGGERGDGLPGALRDRARLTDVAVQRLDRPFVYLPEGRDHGAMAQLLGSDDFASFVERVRERGGTLLLLAPVAVLETEAVRGLFDGRVGLGDVELERIPGPEVLGVVRFDDTTVGSALAAPDRETAPVQRERAARPASAAETTSGVGPPAETPGSVPSEETRAAGLSDASPGDDGEGTGASAPRNGWGRHRARPSFPLRRLALALVLVASLGAGWWLLARAMAGPPDVDADATMGAPRVAPAAVEEPPRPTLDRDAALAALEASPELPYSILIASYAALDDAEERLARLERDETDGLYFLAPTPVRGAVYHRVFAGARPTREDATERMAGLVESGRKDEASDWDVRPARLAFRLGLFGSRAEAEERVSVAAASGIPAYVLAARPVGAPAAAADSAFAVWAGAYESEAAATKMAEMLDGAGVEAELTTRRGAAAP